MAIAPFFFALSFVTLVLAIVAFFQSLRAAFGAEPATEGFEGGRHRPGRAALVDEKEALLRTIKDLAFEREVGKISDEDFERLDREYRARAKEVLRELDEDLAPYFDRAETLFDQVFGEAKADAADELEADAEGKEAVAVDVADEVAADPAVVAAEAPEGEVAEEADDAPDEAERPS